MGQGLSCAFAPPNPLPRLPLFVAARLPSSNISKPGADKLATLANLFVPSKLPGADVRLRLSLFPAVRRPYTP